VTRLSLYALLAVPLCLACTGDETDVEEIPSGSACGEPVEGIEMRFVGLVTDDNGPVANAQVELEDRSFRPAIVLGSATSEANGTYTLDATDITSLPDCWLTALDYRMVAVKDEAEGELMVNRWMWEAIQDESYEVDLTDRPVEMSTP
jgi:hypothetical protein